jgi:hypothetical protein
MHTSRRLRSPSVYLRSHHTRVSTKMNRYQHAVHYARKPRRRRNSRHAYAWLVNVKSDGGTHDRLVTSSLLPQTVEITNRHRWRHQGKASNGSKISTDHTSTYSNLRFEKLLGGSSYRWPRTWEIAKVTSPRNYLRVLRQVCDNTTYLRATPI